MCKWAEKTYPNQIRYEVEPLKAKLIRYHYPIHFVLIMNTHTSYTDRYSAEEMYDGDWDDLLRPDEYEDILDRNVSINLWDAMPGTM